MCGAFGKMLGSMTGGALGGRAAAGALSGPMAKTPAGVILQRAKGKGVAAGTMLTGPAPSAAGTLLGG